MQRASTSGAHANGLIKLLLAMHADGLDLAGFHRCAQMDWIQPTSGDMSGLIRFGWLSAEHGDELVSLLRHARAWDGFIRGGGGGWGGGGRNTITH
jgi:hypothetical protein